jgi:hypothetical protein
MYKLRKNLGIKSQLSKEEITLLRHQAGQQPEDKLQFVQEKTDLFEEFLYQRQTELRLFMMIINASNSVYQVAAILYP